MEKYAVWFYMDNLYEVMEFNPNEDEYNISRFQGTLSDCEAWIRLKENENVSF